MSAEILKYRSPTAIFTCAALRIACVELVTTSG
jgi:hypothetical protein